MAKPHLERRALEHRKNGAGIKEIARMLSVSPSTVSFWCRNIALSPSQQMSLAKRAQSRGVGGLLAHAEKLRTKRQKVTLEHEQRGMAMVEALSDRDITMVGIGLYWGEGYKRGSQEFGFTNSDPKMVTFYIRWLSKVFDVKKSDLILRISINNRYRNDENRLITYWAQHTGVAEKQFTRTSFINAKSKSLSQKPRDYYGTLRIKVRRGTNFRRTILGAIKKLGA